MFARNQSMFAQLETGAGYNKTYQESVLNPYVNKHDYDPTLTLQEMLVAESVQMNGVEVYYIRRQFVKLDQLFGEDLQSKFKKAYKVAMYLESFEEYSGQRDFFSKFGMQVNDEVSFTVSPKLFEHQTDGERAKEGDLIYFPMNNSLFEITWVEPTSPMIKRERLAKYRITAQKFIYSGEEIKPEFDPNRYVLDDTDPFAQVKALDGRMDINLDEFEEDDAIDVEADTFIEEFENIIGTGTPIAEHNKPAPAPVDMKNVFDDLESF
ncbi:neck protein [Aeromonas phage phiAS5]|uniref:Neck protein n=1 Tax=Aeromonas phage phiAS5 TaxID=879630 RepID=E1A2A4_9CAUD|nr:head closure Hc2 [Aeromonas phage phiAS5]ADM79850.1 neck protein [Aeromonas phage phiAS5]